MAYGLKTLYNAILTTVAIAVVLAGIYLEFWIFDQTWGEFYRQ